MTLAEKQQQMIEDFAIIEDAQERLAAIIDRARTRPPLPETARNEENRELLKIKIEMLRRQLETERTRTRAEFN